MTTEVKEKKFDTVKLQRKLREDLSKRIERMTPEQEIEYFKKASEKFDQKRKARR